MEKLEQVKNYWNARPCNIRHSAKPIGTLEYFNEVEQRKYFVEPHIPVFADFKKWENKKVLEIGCGIGTDSINFARHGADLTILEYSSSSLDVCKKRFETFGLNASFYCGNAEKISETVPVVKYDLIYSFGVIHHTPHPEAVIEEIKKYCHANTEVRIMLYSKWCWKVIWILFKYGKGQFWKLDELVRTHAEAQTGCPVAYFYSFADVRKLLKDFDIIEMRKDHIFPYKIDQYVKYQYEKVWYIKWLPQKIFHLLEKKFGWHTLITARLKQPV